MTSRCQEKMIEILSMLTEIPKSKDKKPDKQPDTTDIRELESEESAEEEKKQRGQGLKYLHQSKYLVDYQFL